MGKKDLFDSVNVPEPCSQSWEAMRGDEQSRFCASCEKDIHNLSAMTRGEVKKLLFQSNQSVCVRMEKNADGKLKTLKRQFHQITRRVPIAAGVLTASLTLSAVTSAQKNPPRIGKAAISQAVKGEKSVASISGTTRDPNGAVLPDVQITLFDAKNKTIQKIKSNDEGFYELKNIKAGVYSLQAKARYFTKLIVQNIQINSAETKEIPISLSVGDKTVTVGIYAFTEPLELPKSADPKINDKVQTRQFELLPAVNRRTTFLGLVVPRQVKTANEQSAQNFSRISFTIYDVQDAIIAEETVELTNKKTGQEFVVLTDSRGIAEFVSIPQGRYDLVVSGNGFIEYKATVRIKEQIEPNIEIQMQVGSVVGVIVADWSEIPLFRAIAQDDNETVKRQINSGFAVNAKDENGETALHIAVQHGNLEIIRFLLDKNAKINVKDKSKRPPLAMVFDSFEDDEKINFEILRLLASKGANVNVRDEDGQTFLMRAAEDDNLESVKFLLKSGANSKLKDEDGETAFDKTDSEEIRRLLTANGAIH